MLKENLTRQHDNVFLDQLPFIQGIADALPDMFYLLDLVQKKIIYANQRGLDLLGKNMEDLGEVDSNFFASVVYHEDRLAFNEHLNHLFSASHDDVAELTFRLVHASGKILWVRTRRTIYKRDAHGYPTHVISVSQDISKEKELQEIRAQLENDKR